MPVNLRGVSDEILDQVIAVLRKYESDHPDAVIDLYRQNSVSIQMRIMDPAFRGMSKKQRNDLVWDYLDTLADEAQGDISMLVLLDPSEREKSFSNLEYEDPFPPYSNESRLDLILWSDDQSPINLLIDNCHFPSTTRFPRSQERHDDHRLRTSREGPV